MADDPNGDPTHVVVLGGRRFTIEPHEAGSGYLLRGSEDTVPIASFTREEAEDLARVLRELVSEADA
jgi:hypothetical protein